MTRQYLNDRWCVRCGRTGPTPYLKTHFKRLIDGNSTKAAILDLGCGNGRNSQFFRDSGFTNVVAIDMVGDYGTPYILGQYPLPLFDGTVDIILANYVFMFLDAGERDLVCCDLRRAARPWCKMMVELYAAKDSHTPDDKVMEDLKQELLKKFSSWHVMRSSKGRFIIQRGTEY